MTVVKTFYVAICTNVVEMDKKCNKSKKKQTTVTVMKLISVANYKNVVEMNQKTKKSVKEIL